MPKEIVCYDGGAVVHFRYPSGGRLVLMTGGGKAAARTSPLPLPVAAPADNHSPF